MIEKELAMIMACDSEEKLQELTERLTEQHKNDTRETVMENLRDLGKEIEALRIETKLLKMSEYGISLTHVAEKYLHKSLSYLSQRLHGNRVNGRQATLTEEDIHKIQNGLFEMSNNIRDLASSLG
ncbi:MAG: DUF5053 domain-containing protein [Culturomica sp.]|nr:DUF5053 domain-containing protein [Culturomica sp.]